VPYVRLRRHNVVPPTAPLQSRLGASGLRHRTAAVRERLLRSIQSRWHETGGDASNLRGRHLEPAYREKIGSPDASSQRSSGGRLQSRRKPHRLGARRQHPSPQRRRERRIRFRRFHRRRQHETDCIADFPHSQPPTAAPRKIDSVGGSRGQPGPAATAGTVPSSEDYKPSGTPARTVTTWPAHPDPGTA
jgi:hypothetical protein